MDFIGLFPTSQKGYWFILHIIDYFSRFSITTTTKTANTCDVIPALDRVFALYATPEGTYCDQGHHFNNQEVRDFFSRRGIALAFSLSGALQRIGMVEIGNRLSEDVLRKAGDDWEEGLNRSTHALNSRIIWHLGVAPSSILLEVGPTPSSVDPTLRLVHTHSVTAWKDELLDLIKHKELVGQYFTYRAQCMTLSGRNRIKKRSRDHAIYCWDPRNTFIH